MDGQSAPVNKIWPNGSKLGKVSDQEAKVFSMIQALMEDYFTGSVNLHISEGSIRKVETTAVERITD